MRWWLLLLVLVVGCGKHTLPAPKLPPSAFSTSLLVDLGLETADSSRDPKYVLVGTDPTQARALLWSGEIGINVGPYGSAKSSGDSTWPGFLDTRYDLTEKIQPIPSPLAVTILANGQPVNPGASGYWQSLDMRYGLLTSHWFAPVAGGLLEARLSSAVLGASICSEWEFHGPSGTELTISAEPKAPGRLLQVFHRGSARVAEPPNSADETRLRVDRGLDRAPSSTIKLTLDAVGGTWVAETNNQMGWGGVVPTYPRALSSVLPEAHDVLMRFSAPEIAIDGPLADQRAINSFLFYLRMERSGSYDTYESQAAARFSPFGLSSNRYNGHVFWDADVWLMPALAFVDPGILPDYTTYRLSTLRDPPDAPFPWEDCLTGKEAAPGESVKEIHISGSVLWGLEFAKALGVTVEWDVKKRGARYYVQRVSSRSNNSKAIDVVKRVGDYYADRATKRPDGKFGLLDVMSPDENHTGPNDLYTNLVAQWAINGATWRPAAKPAATMFLPSDAKGFLAYENDPVRSYKQAAAVLSIYPLQYPPAEAQARSMLDRFQGKVIPNGPAMSDSIHATIWARLGERDKAYEVWKKSWGDYLKGPMLLFSEKRSTPTTYFTTGAAGCLQSVIYGFLGFRVDERPEGGAAWKLQLKNGRWLSIKPHLPAAWKSATFRHFHVLGRTYTLTVKREGSKTVTSVKQGV